MLALQVVFLTITVCAVNPPHHCKDLRFTNPRADTMGCQIQGQRSASMVFRNDGNDYIVKKWRCSGRQMETTI